MAIVLSAGARGISPMRTMASIVSFALVFSALLFFPAASAQAVVLSDNSPVFQITFTGFTSLPSSQRLVSPNGIQAAWTLNGTQPTDANFIDVANQPNAYYTVAVPTSGTHSGALSSVPATIISSDVVMLTLRDNPTDGITASLAGYLGDQTSAVGQKALGTFADHLSASGNPKAKELISFGQFAGFQYLEDAFARVPATFSISAKLPSTVTDLSYSFGNQIISSWNKSDISSWDVSRVTNFSYMFYNAGTFNQDLSSWNTGSATNMSFMFSGAAAFNQSIGSWDTSRTTDMSYMFKNALAFNQSLNNWDTRRVMNMSFMFYGANTFNGNISSWNLLSASNMSYMFYGASSFNINLTNWNTSKVTTMSSMFLGASAFNGDLSGWNTSNVYDMSSMFSGAASFNSDISMWDVSHVGKVSNMFQNATAFNQPIGTWNTQYIKDMSYMFNGATAFNQPIGTWNTKQVTTMSSMFNRASSYNQPLSDWNVSQVKNFYNMFNGATVFNQPLSDWNVSQVTNFSYMFYGATSFNQSLSTWVILSATEIQNMFTNAIAFNQPMHGIQIGILANGTTSTVTFHIPSGMSQTNINETIASWADQSPATALWLQMDSPSSKWYSDCRSYAAWTRLLAHALIHQSGGTVPVAPSGCTTSTFSWLPNQSPGSATISNNVQSFTPSSMPNGVSDYRFTSMDRECTVNPNTGVVSYIKTALTTCTIRAWDNDPNGSMSFVDIIFTRPAWLSPPSKPTAVSGTLTGTGIHFSWAAPTSPGSSPITGYLIVNTTNSSTILCLVPATTLSCDASTGFRAPGTQENIYYYAISDAGISPFDYINIYFDLAPSAPVITSIVPGSALDLSLTYIAPESVPGTSIASYEYSTNAGTNWRAVSGGLGPNLTLPLQSTGANFVGGTSYSVLLRAKTSTAPGAVSPASAAVNGTPIDRQIGAPTVSSYSASTGTVTLTFTAPALTGSAITDYQYSTDGGSTWRAKGSLVSPLSITVTSDTGATLVDNTTYSVMLRAVTGAGSGLPTAALTMKSNRTPTAPTSPSATLLGTSATVSWSNSVVGLGITYLVTSTPGGLTCTVDQPSTSCTVNSLSYGTSYTFTVKATNTAGSSTSVASAAVLPEITPGSPTITTITGGSQQLVVNFTAGINSGSAITKYQYSTDGGTAWRDAIGLTSPLTLTTISGVANTALVNGASYSVKIRSYNSRAGVESNQVTQAAGDMPGVPSGVVATTTGTAATVSWTASTGTVSSYQVTTTPGGLTCTVAAPATTCNVSGLTYGTSYTFAVVGTNTYGSSAASAASVAVVPDVAPGAPTLTSITPADGQLSLAFTAGPNTGSSIVRYQYSTDAGTTWKDTDTVRTVSPIVITSESASSNSLTNLTSYTVKLRAVNSIPGAGSATVTAMPMPAPGSPTGAAASLSGTIANISWTAPTGSTPVSSYLVTSNTGGFICSATYPTSTCTVTGLALTVAYTFTVTATNAAGDSAASAATNAVTPEFAPGAPMISAITAGVGQLSVAFTGGTNTGSSLTKYQYSTDAGSTWNNFSTDSVASPQVISGLTSGTAYDLQIRAYNTIPGTASVTVTATAGTVPGAPTTVSAVASNGSATVSWTAPASNGGVAISSYTATSSVGNKTCTISVASTSCVVSGLTNGLSYTFNVTATNSIGSSASSAASAAVVPENAPGAPTITALTPSNQQISVAFTAGSNVGSAITKYQYSLDGGSSWNDPIVGVIASPLIMTGLTNGTVYNVQIRAVNTIPGVSSGSSSATPATVPGAPTSVSAVTGSANATVSWTAPVSNGGASISSYTVTSSPGSFSCTATAPTTSCVVSSLTNGVAYTFTVKANNSTGFSVASSATSSVTPDVAPGRPTAIRIVPGDRQLSIEFSAGTNTGSAITKYQYTTDNPVNNPMWKDLPSRTSPFILTKDSNNVDLVNGETYTVYLRAVNTLPSVPSQGLTNYADAQFSAPTITSITRGDAQLSIAFNPGTTLSGSALNSYKYSTDGGSTWAYKMTTTSPFTITQTSTGTSLVNGTTYNVKIAGFNTILGMPSNTVSATPKAEQAVLNWNMQTSSVVNHATLTLVTSGGSGTGQVVFSAGPNCSVVNNILTAGDAGGTCTVTATKSADTYYASKDISSDLVVTLTKADQTTTPFLTNASSIVYGQSLTLAGSGGSGTGAYSYGVQSAGTTGCAVNSGTGVLTVTATGTCIVTVERADSTNFNASFLGTQSISVTSAPQSVSFTSKIPTTPIAGGTYDVTATASTGLPVSFSIQSGNCSISSTTVSFAASGNCVIKASRAATSQYAAATDVYQTISVGQRNQVINFTNQSRAISQKTYGDASFLVEATSSESAAVLTYTVHTSTTNSACSVTSTGLVRVLAVGSCVIEANAAASGAFAAASPVLLSIPVVSEVAAAPFITSVSAGNQAITVSFTEPSYDGGTAVSGYRVAAMPQSGSTPTIFESGCNPTATNGIVTCTVRGLANGVDYKVQVAGINAAGLGVYSEESNSLTVATNPSAVQNLSVVQDNTQLVISWADPDSLGGGTFQEYRLFVKRSADASYDQNNYFVVASSATRSLTISALSPSGASLVNGVGYDIKVITVTSANSSELTANTAVVNQIPRTVPDAPRFSSAFVLGSNIVLTWETPASDGGASISSYDASVAASPCTFAAVTDTVCTVPLPSSGYSIDYEVKAVNVAGQSVPATGTLQIAIPPVVTPPTQTDNQISGGTSAFTQQAPLAITEPIVTVIPDLVPSESETSQKSSTSAQGKKDSQNLYQQPLWQVVSLWLLIFLIIALILAFIVRRAITRNEI